MAGVRRPEDWPRSFEERINGGDLEGALALYDPDARFVTPAGDVLSGRDAMRAVLGGLVAARTRFRSRVVRAVTAGDVAVLYTDFDGESQDATGRAVPVRSAAIEVLRRRADGGWLLLVGDPNGRKRDSA
jgi:uncharacterized protein (TIGR02246 family)